MRRTPAVLTITALAGLALVGCTPSGGASVGCERVADSDPGTMSLIEVSGALQAPPEAEIRTPFTPSESAYADVERGEGPAIRSMEQAAVLDISLFDGATGTPLIGTAYDGNVSAPSAVQNWVAQFPGMEDALLCATEGSRIAVALDDDGVSPQTRQQYAQAGVPSEGALVAVVDVRKVLPRAASGEVQYNDGLGLPSVVRAPDGRPGIIVPDATAPDEVVVQTLIKGDGPELADGDVPFVQYTGVTWADREVFDSTWENGAPIALDPARVVPGFAQALEGQTVGSQVMVVIPPDQGYGAQAQGPIPANSTLVFVIDILDVQEPASAAQ